MNLICSESRLLLYSLCMALFCLAVSGCGGSTTKVVHGTVTCGGQKATDGDVCFVPVEGTGGPVSSGLIVDGEYRIEARGGVPVGKHRVEVRASKNTGRKSVAAGRSPGERVMTDEVISISPMAYEGKQSPLIVEVTSSGDGRIDIEIPGRK